jgi:hypothetical protein
MSRHPAVVSLTCAVLTSLSLFGAAQEPRHRTFGTPEEAVRALADAAKTGNADALLAIFGPDGQDLVASSDPATTRKNLEVFTVAFAERWRLEDQGTNRKTLIIGDEEWPFPVPLVKDANAWRFDTASGKEEVIDRRIGRNELAVIGVCRSFVAAQRHYARQGHDGKPAGLYAKTFASDPGKQNGLYWPAARGQARSPLGELVSQAAQEGRTLGPDRTQPSPFHGYYFKILTAQGAAAAGGAKAYVVNGEMSEGFALVAWPAQYDASGVMTFIVNQDGTLCQKDLGPETDRVARAMTAYNPDKSWTKVE